jgi:hypothetical protein
VCRNALLVKSYVKTICCLNTTKFGSELEGRAPSRDAVISSVKRRETGSVVAMEREGTRQTVRTPENVAAARTAFEEPKSFSTEAVASRWNVRGTLSRGLYLHFVFVPVGCGWLFSSWAVALRHRTISGFA